MRLLLALTFIAVEALATYGGYSPNAIPAGAITDAQLATSYVKANGTRPLTADWAAGGFGLTGVTKVTSNTASPATAQTGFVFLEGF